MEFNPYYSEVSDESLFLQMTLGDKMAASILVKRFEHLGRQMAGVYIRNECLRDKTDIDYYETIQDSINKAFRYYQIGQGRFYIFCRNILEQNLCSQTQKFVTEKEKQKELVSLDSSIKYDSTLSYHDVIADTRELSLAEHYDVDDVLDKLSSLKEEHAPAIYLLYSQGISQREIARQVKLSLYRVREIIKTIELYLDGINLRLR